MHLRTKAVQPLRAVQRQPSYTVFSLKQNGLVGYHDHLLPVLEVRSALFEKCSHTFTSIVDRECRLECAPLKSKALRKKSLIRDIDSFLYHHHRRPRLRRNLGSNLPGLFH